MRNQILIFLIVLLALSCGEKRKSLHDRMPQGTIHADQPDLSDREANGGMLRFTLEGKAMFDKFFVAQFTPRGDLFNTDNLQLYNYNPGSDKYPQFIINIDYEESDLHNWAGKTFPLDFLAFTAAENTLPLNSKGKIEIMEVTETKVEGRFSGQLIHPTSRKTFEIRGEFKAMIKVNV